MLANMSSHPHKFENDVWPFSDPENVAAISCRHVLDGHPILRVSHDDDDGCWQLLCGSAHSSEDAKVVCLGCMLKRDPSLAELADLPLGWGADRESLLQPWTREVN